MNGDKFARILTLLAAAGIPNSEFDDFVETIQMDEVDATVRQYRTIKTRLSKIHLQDEGSPHSTVAVTSPTSTALKETQRLLDNIGLPVTIGAPNIVDILVRLGLVSDKDSIRFSPKDGFSRWFKKASAVVGPNNLLRAATILASEKTSAPRRDWSLSGDKDS